MFYVIRLRWCKRFLRILFLLIFVWGAINLFFPRTHLAIIKEYSTKYNVEPTLILAIIHTESKFKATAISNKGARGLMQISKSTADWAAKEIGLKNYSYEQIFEPQINIQIGCWYIEKLFKQFDSFTLAVCAYNAGSGNVTKWLQKYSTDGKKLSYIPFKETRNYLKKVVRYKKIYDFLFNVFDKR